MAKATEMAGVVGAVRAVPWVLRDGVLAMAGRREVVMGEVMVTDDGIWER